MDARDQERRPEARVSGTSQAMPAEYPLITMKDINVSERPGRPEPAVDDPDEDETPVKPPPEDDPDPVDDPHRDRPDELPPDNERPAIKEPPHGQ